MDLGGDEVGDGHDFDLGDPHHAQENLPAQTLTINTGAQQHHYTPES